MSLKKTDTHVHSLKVRYSEIDSQSIVYNSHYLTYYDISLADLLDQAFNQEEYINETQSNQDSSQISLINHFWCVD